jgi:hypothetical protein
MQHLQVLENLEKKDALSAGPDFLGAAAFALPPRMSNKAFKPILNR